MKTYTCKNQDEVDRALSKGPCNITLENLQRGVTIDRKKIGCLSFKNGTYCRVNILHSDIEKIIARSCCIRVVKSKIGHLTIQSKNTYTSIHKSAIETITPPSKPTGKEIKFLKSIFLEKLHMSYWASDDDWLDCKTTEEVHNCGTTFCLAGYAQALSLNDNIRALEPEEAGEELIPNLAYLFFMDNDIVEKEIKKIIA